MRGLQDAAEHHGLTVVDQHLVVISCVSIEGTFTPPEATTTWPTLSSCTSRSRMMRLSGVICGVTFSDSTAFLN